MNIYTHPVWELFKWIEQTVKTEPSLSFADTEKLQRPTWPCMKCTAAASCVSVPTVRTQFPESNWSSTERNSTPVFVCRWDAPSFSSVSVYFICKRTEHINQHYCKCASLSQLANSQLQSFGKMLWNQRPETEAFKVKYSIYRTGQHNNIWYNIQYIYNSRVKALLMAVFHVYAASCCQI